MTLFNSSASAQTLAKKFNIPQKNKLYKY